jgi:hypothetical protein
MLCSGDGRPLSLSDWKRMRADVTKLYNRIDRIELTWTDEAGPAVSGMTDADAEAPVTAACSDTEAAPIAESTSVEETAPVAEVSSVAKP